LSIYKKHWGRGVYNLTVKKYLKRFGDLDLEIKMKYEQLQKLYAVRSVPAASQNNLNAEAFSDIDAAFANMEQQYAADIKRLLQLRHDIQNTINSLDDSTQRIVLTEKYINLKQPDDIAIEIPCDVRTVYRWLNEAILALQTQYPSMFEAEALSNSR